MEVALPELAGHLASIVNWLLRSETNSSIKVVLTVEINRDQPQIVIKCWERAAGMHAIQPVNLSRVRRRATITDGPP